jgi:hypothetical protein
VSVAVCPTWSFLRSDIAAAEFFPPAQSVLIAVGLKRKQKKEKKRSKRKKQTKIF